MSSVKVVFSFVFNYTKAQDMDTKHSTSNPVRAVERMSGKS